MNRALSSRDFNQDTAAAKRAAKEGPVFITDRGRAAYVLMTVEDYQRLSGTPKSLAEALGMAEGGDIEFDPPRFRDLPREVDFD